MSRARKLLLLATMLVVAVSLFAVPASAQMKIGYIRSDYIFSKYEPYTEAQKELDKILDEEQSKIQSMYEDLQAKAEEAESQAILMTEEMKQDKYQELQKQQMELEQYHQSVFGEQGSMSKKQEELLGPIIDKINDVLIRLAKDEGYDYIFDAMAGGPILFANEAHDISDHLLEELNSELASQ